MSSERYIKMNATRLKVIGIVSMTIDHIGYFLFPQMTVLRIIGRLAYPIFAYMIAEGCRYTRNKVRYLCTVLAIAGVCSAVTYFAERSITPVLVWRGRSKAEKLAGLTIGLCLLSVELGMVQFYSLAAVILLYFYNGERGNYSLKWAFYAYYPLHIAVLYGISQIVG